MPLLFNLVRRTGNLSKANFIHCHNRLIMTTERNSKGKDHLEVTRDQCRSSSDHEAIVKRISQLSPTVKGLELQVKGQDASNDPHSASASFDFLPGQWLDVFIPGVAKVGGFSITSSPGQLRSTGLLDLAVKYSTWPPAHWVHTQCREGSSVKIRSGGDFTLPINPTGDLVFIAGGVGINPIASMLFHLHDLNYAFQLKLLYTAKTIQELIFKDRLDSLAHSNRNFQVQYYVTGSDTVQSHELENRSLMLQHRRMREEDILKSLTRDTSTVFVCGPPPLIELTIATQSNCQGQNLEVKYEKWWM